MSSCGSVFCISHWKENYTLPAFPAAAFPLLIKTRSINTPPAGTQYKSVSGDQQFKCQKRKVHQQPLKLPFQISGASFIRLIEKKKKKQTTENPSLLNTYNHFSTRCFTISLTHGFQVCSDFDCYLFARCMSSRMMCPDEWCQRNREVRQVAWRDREGDWHSRAWHC